jgi:hypothetical protein
MNELATWMDDHGTDNVPTSLIGVMCNVIEQDSKPTPAEELLYKFVIVGAETISYMGQHPRGKAYVDDLQKIFDGACRHLIARQKQGVDFAYLNPKSFTAKDAKAAK